MREYLPHLKEKAVNKLTCAVYRGNDLIKDCWDMGVAGLGGTLFSYHGTYLNLFGNYDALAGLPLFLGGTFLGEYAGSENESSSRISRNGFFGFTAMLIGSGDPLSIGASVLTGTATVLMELERRKQKELGLANQVLEGVL